MIIEPTDTPPHAIGTEPTSASNTASGPTRTTRKWWQMRAKTEKKPRRSLLLRLFGIGVWGSIKLFLLCVLVGFVLLAMDFDPAAPNFDMTDAIGAFLKNAWATARWAVTNFWKPALAGASIVLPLWILWRLISLPFRR